MPEAAPVVARIIVGHTRSRSLLQQTIAIRLVPSSLIVVLSLVVVVPAF